MLTAGAMSGDFGLLKKVEYHLLTRVDANFNSLAKFIVTLLDEYNWKKMIQVVLVFFNYIIF